MKKLAVIYDRASTQAQADNWSREDAIRKGKELAKIHGYEWELRQEVVSGEELTNRPVMLSILDDIRAGKIQALIVQNFSRLSRDEDGIDGRIIKRACKENDVLIVTPERVYDFSNDQDSKMSDIEMLIGSWYKQELVRNICQGMREKAKQGGWNGGPTPLGYKVVYNQPENPNEKPKGDLAICEEERPLIELIFELYPIHGGRKTASILNEKGYKSKNGNLFSTKVILQITENPIYAGFIAWGKEKKSRYLREYEREFVHRPDLQIIPVNVLERATQTRKDRARGTRRTGKWAYYPFTGFIVCGTCGGPCHAGTHKLNGKLITDYRCRNRARFGKTACPHGMCYRSELIADVLIPFMAQSIQDQIGLNNALNRAADEFGRTATEQEIENEIKVELLKIKEAKQRVINSIANGILTDKEAYETLTDFRDKEDKLQRELATIDEKISIRSDYQEAMDALRDADVEQTLWKMYESQPAILRRLLELIFEPRSIKLESHRVKGHVNKRVMTLIDYRFTSTFLETQSRNNGLALVSGRVLNLQRNIL